MRRLLSRSWLALAVLAALGGATRIGLAQGAGAPGCVPFPEGYRGFTMHEDRQRFAATGGWGVEGFEGDTRERAVSDAGAQCFACHESRKAQDFVFSAWRE
jgi:hypothetical protein